MGNHTSKEEFEKLFSNNKPVKIDEISERLGVSRPTVSNLMKRNQTLTSVNYQGKYCVLPRMCKFDQSGFTRFGKLLFYQNGNQLDAIVYLVSTSERGLIFREITDFFKTRITGQLKQLCSQKRITRKGRPRKYVYYSIVPEEAARQRQAREEFKQRINTDANADLETEDHHSLVVFANALMEKIKRPDATIKSIALSLQRRGEDTSMEQIKKLFERYGIIKKNSSGY